MFWHRITFCSCATLSPVIALATALAPPARAATTRDDPKLPAWFHVVKGAHYTIHTGVNDEALVAELSRRMDVMYDQYCLAMRPFRPVDETPLKVVLFEKRKTYMAFTNNVATNTGGFFRPGEHPMLVSYLDDNGRDGLRRTLQHEAFHGFAYFAISRNIPTWLNEGMAQLFEEGIWTGKKFLMGQVPPRRLRQLHSDVRGHKLVPFDQFFRVTPERWAKTLHGNANAGATYYGEAWAIAYFLQFGPDQRDRDHFLDALAGLHAEPDGDGQQIFAARFPDTAALQRAFEAWVLQLRATPEALLLERQSTLGDFLADLQPSHPHITRNVQQFRNDMVGYSVSLKYRVGAVTYETVKPASIYFCGLDGQPYTEAQLFFEKSKGAPLPDLVCRPNASFVLRTHFYKGPDDVEHECSITPTQ